jgi:hypothetical protein
MRREIAAGGLDYGMPVILCGEPKLVPPSNALPKDTHTFAFCYSEIQRCSISLEEESIDDEREPIACSLDLVVWYDLGKGRSK